MSASEYLRKQDEARRRGAAMISDEEDIDPDFYDPRIELMSDTTKTSAAPMSWEFHQILLALRRQERRGMSDKDVLRWERLKG